MGVPYETFWNLTPKKIEPFIEAFRQKQIYEAEAFKEQTNFTAWLNGIYISHAISACYSKNAVYPEIPLDLSGKSNNDEQDAIKFEAWALAFNAERKKKQ